MDIQPALSSSALHPPQSTATILEFRCLYTTDLRRKQKRWQDGRLKFHTFNKRVMVYDEKANFVGDTHWVQDHDFDEGEELELERGGVIVQVADCIGTKNQDLSDLLDKRAREKEARASVRGIRPSLQGTPGTDVPINRLAAPAFSLQLNSNSFENLAETPMRRTGRAIMPKISPYDERQKSFKDNKNERLAKRRKLILPESRSGYAQNLTGATLTLSGQPTSSAPLRLDTSRARTTKVQDVETIDITSDEAITIGTVTGPLSDRIRGQRSRKPSPLDNRTLTATSKRDKTIDTISVNQLSASTLILPINLPSKVQQGTISNDGSDDEFIDIDTLIGTQHISVQLSSLQHPKTSQTQGGMQCAKSLRGKKLNGQGRTSHSASNRQHKKMSDRIEGLEHKSLLSTGVDIERLQKETSSKQTHCNTHDDRFNEDCTRPTGPLRIKSRPKRAKLVSISRSSHTLQMPVANFISPSSALASSHVEITEGVALSRDLKRLCASDQMPESTMVVSTNQHRLSMTDEDNALSPGGLSLDEQPNDTHFDVEESLVLDKSYAIVQQVQNASLQGAHQHHGLQNPMVERHDDTDMSRIEASRVKASKRDSYYQVNRSVNTASPPADKTSPSKVVTPEQPFQDQEPFQNPSGFDYNGKVSTASACQTPLTHESGEPRGFANNTRTSPLFPCRQMDGKPQSEQFENMVGSLHGPVTDGQLSIIQSKCAEVLRSERQAIPKFTLSNPATRGRKAARQEDSMLAIASITEQPGFHSINSMAPPPKLPLAQSRHKANVSLRNDQPVVYQPVMTTSNDLGPWSREASDLLDWKKPSAIANN